MHDVGNAIKESEVPREFIFITSKARNLSGLVVPIANPRLNKCGMRSMSQKSSKKVRADLVSPRASCIKLMA